LDYLSRAIAAVESGAGCERLHGHDRLLGKVRGLMEEPGVPAPEPETPPETAARPAGDARRPAAAAEASSVRVDTTKLDYLVDMVGEMAIARSLVRHNQAAAGDPRLHRDLAQLTRHHRRSAADRHGDADGSDRPAFPAHGPPGPRPVAEGRQAGGTRHMRREHRTRQNHCRGTVRSTDAHGAQCHRPRHRSAHRPPGGRQGSAGQDHSGRVSPAGQIAIEAADDGRGLDARKILARARQKALTEHDARLSESDTFRLILEPGFSTADQVTDISGRGVGMDVVRRQVEKLRGRIEIRSQAGLGTTFLLKLPLTLAIVDGLVVTVGRHRYIVLLFAVREMFRPAAESIFTVQNRQEMALVRGRLPPVLRLYRRFGLAPRTEDPCQALPIVAETEGQPSA
jgi:two-component system chemotaxis sensor kinase CheA